MGENIDKKDLADPTARAELISNIRLDTKNHTIQVLGGAKWTEIQQRINIQEDRQPHWEDWPGRPEVKIFQPK